MKMLNSKSCIECDEFDEMKHNNELMTFGDKLTELEDYNCIVLQKYQDIANSNIDMDVISDVTLWNIYDLAEFVDCKNGANLLIDDEGFLNLSVYGQMYEYNGDNHFNHCAFKIMPHDEDMNLLDVSGFILNGESVKLSKIQLKKEKESTINLLNKMKEKVQENHSFLKKNKKRQHDGER